MFGEDVRGAINSEELSLFCISILEYADEVTKIFDEIDNKISELKEYLDPNILTKINDEYEKIKKNYKTIHENMISYSNDFIKVKNIIEEGMNEIKINFQNKTEEFLKENKEVNIWD